MLEQVEYPPVLSKSDFVRRYQAGEFGNASPTWNDCDSFLAWGQREFGTGPSRGLYHLRNRTAGGATFYNLHWSECVARWLERPDRENWYVSAMAPTESTIIQGEVVQRCFVGDGSGAGLSLLYSRVRKPMRDALAEDSQTINGIAVNYVLEGAMDSNSYEWLQTLLLRYPGHVVEFSTYSTQWGTLYPLFNTVFWEVRLY